MDGKMKTKVIERHWVESPVLSRYGGDIERDFIPRVSRTLYVRVWPFWFAVKTQTLKKVLNEYILSATMGDQLDYSSYWHYDLQKADEVIRL